MDYGTIYDIYDYDIVLIMDFSTLLIWESVLAYLLRSSNFLLRLFDVTTVPRMMSLLYFLMSSLASF